MTDLLDGVTVMSNKVAMVKRFTHIAAEHIRQAFEACLLGQTQQRQQQLAAVSVANVSAHFLRMLQIYYISCCAKYCFDKCIVL